MLCFIHSTVPKYNHYWSLCFYTPSYSDIYVVDNGNLFHFKISRAGYHSLEHRSSSVFE